MGDLISREAAISAMYLLQIEDEETYGCSIPEGFDGERAAEALRKLPSAEPTERTAKVIDKSVGRHSIIDFDWIGKCEKCGNEIQYAYDYCPYCGSRLDWSENE